MKSVIEDYLNTPLKESLDKANEATKLPLMDNFGSLHEEDNAVAIRINELFAGKN